MSNRQVPKFTESRYEIDCNRSTTIIVKVTRLSGSSESGEVIIEIGPNSLRHYFVGSGNKTISRPFNSNQEEFEINFNVTIKGPSGQFPAATLHSYTRDIDGNLSIKSSATLILNC